MSASLVMEQLAHTAGIRLVQSTELYPELHAAGDAGLPLLVVENRLGRAVIALQGAHVMAFKPAGQQEMLWLSPRSALKAGVPIRGGIPLCVPWFGPAEGSPLMHGFGRIREWSLVAAEACADGATRIVLELASETPVDDFWPHAFSFRLEVVIGTSLSLAMQVVNRGNAPAPLQFAFHTYFIVPSVAEALVTGLENTTYLDKADEMKRKAQKGEIAITEFTNRIYLDVPDVQVLKAASGNVKIESKAKCAVVWNAWNEDKTMADMGEGNHKTYLCIERGDVADYAVTIPAGESYRTAMTLSR